MIEMTVKEMQQVSGAGGLSGGVVGSATTLGVDRARDDAASLLGRKPGVGMGDGVAGSATPLGRAGGISGDF